jgi:MFS family permease
MYLLETLRISQGSVGTIVAAFSIAALLVRPFSGYIIDNYRRAGVLILAVSGMTALYGIYPLIGSVVGMFLLRFAHGAVFGVCTSSSATIVADIVPPSLLGQGIGIYALSIPVGMIVGPLFGLKLLQARGPYVMFLAILGVSFLSLVGALCTRGASRPVVKKKFSATRLFHKKAFPISLCMFFIMNAYGAIIVFVGIYAAQKGFPNVASFFLCFSAAIFFSRLCSGKLFDKGHIFWLILAGHLLAAAGTLWLGYATNPGQFLVAAMICGLGFGILMPTSQAAVNALATSNERGVANSTYLTSYDLGVGVSSFLVGFLSDTVTLGEIYRYCTVLIIASAGIFMLKAIPHYHTNRPDQRTVP